MLAGGKFEAMAESPVKERDEIRCCQLSTCNVTTHRVPTDVHCSGKWTLGVAVVAAAVACVGYLCRRRVQARMATWASAVCWQWRSGKSAGGWQSSLASAGPRLSWKGGAVTPEKDKTHQYTEHTNIYLCPTHRVVIVVVHVELGAGLRRRSFVLAQWRRRWRWIAIGKRSPWILQEPRTFPGE